MTGYSQGRYDVLIVSSNEKFGNTLKRAISDERSRQIELRSRASKARRELEDGIRYRDNQQSGIR